MTPVLFANSRNSMTFYAGSLDSGDVKDQTNDSRYIATYEQTTACFCDAKMIKRKRSVVSDETHFLRQPSCVQVRGKLVAYESMEAVDSSSISTKSIRRSGRMTSAMNRTSSQ
jgi:hypothetical protein